FARGKTPKAISRTAGDDTGCRLPSRKKLASGIENGNGSGFRARVTIPLAVGFRDEACGRPAPRAMAPTTESLLRFHRGSGKCNDRTNRPAHRKRALAAVELCGQ